VNVTEHSTSLHTFTVHLNGNTRQSLPSKITETSSNVTR